MALGIETLGGHLCINTKCLSLKYLMILVIQPTFLALNFYQFEVIVSV
jgi:hypothetical protein